MHIIILCPHMNTYKLIFQLVLDYIHELVCTNHIVAALSFVYCVFLLTCGILHKHANISILMGLLLVCTSTIVSPYVQNVYTVYAGI